MANKKKDDFVEPRINDEIYGNPNVRAIYQKNPSESCDEDFNRVMSLSEAKKIARNLNLDVIEINGKTSPIIVRIANYSKYLYELKKKLKNKQKTKNELKEIQLRANISAHDLQTKAKKANEFISEGDKVKVVLVMRGRELSRREQSKKPIYDFIEQLSEVAVKESEKDEGNKCIVILKKK